MKSILVENSAWKQDQWLKFVNKCAEKLPFKFAAPLDLEVNKKEIVFSAGSIGGVELLLQSNGLKVFPSSLPSRKDIRFIKQIVSSAVRQDIKVLDADSNDVSTRDFSDDKVVSLVETAIKESKAKADVTVQFGDRRFDIQPHINYESDVLDIERDLIDKTAFFRDAADPDVYPVDGKESIIWDGSRVWLDNSVEQILFSQKAFKGKLCGQIDKNDFTEAVPDRIHQAGNGMVIDSQNQFSTSDFDAVNVRMSEHFEKKEVKKKYGRIEIEVGKLQEISYVLSRAVLDNKSLAAVSEQYEKQGIDKDQMELTAVAVSAIIEIAAFSQGKSLEEMHKALIKKTKLTQIAAKAVVDGFVQAAADADPPGTKKINWLSIVILGMSAGIIVWYFFLKDK